MRDVISMRGKLNSLGTRKVRLAQQKSPSSEADVWGKRITFLLILLWPLTLIVGFNSILLIVNLIGLAMAVVGIRYRAVGLIGISLLCTLDPLTRNLLATGGLWRWNTLNYWLLLYLFLNLPYILRLRDRTFHLLLAFTMFLVLMLPISLNISGGVQDVLNVVSVFGLVVYFAHALPENRVLRWVGIVCGVTGAVAGGMYYIQIDKLPFVNPNSWSQFPLTAIFAISFAMPEAIKNKSSRFPLAVLVVLNIIWVFLSGSRGSLLTAFVCVLFMVVSIRSFSWTSLILALGIGGMFWASNFLLDQELYALQRLQKLFDPTYTMAQRTSGRSDLFQTGWEIFKEQPIGIGTGSFRYGAGYLGIEGKSLSAHSAWVKTLAENGFMGVILLSLWVVSYFVTGIQNKEFAKKGIGILTTAVISVIFLSKEFQGKDLWFLAAGAMVYLNEQKYLDAEIRKTRKFKHRRTTAFSRTGTRINE